VVTVAVSMDQAKFLVYGQGRNQTLHLRRKRRGRVDLWLSMGHLRSHGDERHDDDDGDGGRSSTMYRDHSAHVVFPSRCELPPHVSAVVVRCTSDSARRARTVTYDSVVDSRRALVGDERSGALLGVLQELVGHVQGDGV
jgi:hypothetical protein